MELFGGCDDMSSLKKWVLCKLLRWHNPQHYTLNGKDEVQCADCEKSLEWKPKYKTT
jgi:hypothetical protein